MYIVCISSYKFQVYDQTGGMKFIVDAQLPVQLSKFLESKGFETIHTDHLPLLDRTPDLDIRIFLTEKMGY